MINQKPEGFSKSAKKLEDGIGNTRLKLQTKVRSSAPQTHAEPHFETHLDYLRIICKFYGSDEVVLPKLQELLTFAGGSDVNWEIIRDRSWSPGSGAKSYSHTIKGLEFSGGFKPLTEFEDSLGIEVMLDFPGSYFDRKTLIDTFRLCRGFQHRYGARATRVDIALDASHDDLIPIKQMLAAYKKGNGVFFASYSYAGKHNIRTGEKSVTHYFGSRNSGKMVRIYWHRNDDGSLVPRFETEFKRGYAQPIFSTICSTAPHNFDRDSSELEQDLADTLKGFAVGVIDFVDKSKSHNRKRCPRLRFWSKFLKISAAPIRIKMEKPTRSLGQTLQWLDRQVLPSLLSVREGLGDERFAYWINKSCSNNIDRLKSYGQMVSWHIAEDLKGKLAPLGSKWNDLYSQGVC